MSENTCPSTVSRQMEAIAFIIIQLIIFRNARRIKRRISLGYSPVLGGTFNHEMRLDESGASKNI